jgi:hypothetical protein
MTTGTSLAELLEALREWLLANPNGDLQDFAAEHDTTPQELAEGWNTYFAQADFSRNYDLDTSTSQSGAQGATQAAAQAAPVYTPSSPPPYNASPAEYEQYLTQEVNNFQEFTTINNITNNITDQSFNQQIIAGGDVNQDIDIDNSEQTVEEGGVLIDDSNLDDVDINTGDVGAGGVLQQGDDNQAATGDENVLQDGDGNVGNTGDLTATDGSAVSVGGDATTIGSGNDNFGSGQQGVNVAVGDGNQQANQQQDNETNIELDDVDVTGGDASADGGDGGRGGDGDGGDGGSGGDGGDGDGGFPFGPAGDGGDGGAGGAGGTGAGGSADGGSGGIADGGDAGIDIDAGNEQSIDF